MQVLGFLSGPNGKESAYNAGDLGSIPGLGRSLEEGMVTHSRTAGVAVPRGLCGAQFPASKMEPAP